MRKLLHFAVKSCFANQLGLRLQIGKFSLGLLVVGLYHLAQRSQAHAHLALRQFGLRRWRLRLSGCSIIWRWLRFGRGRSLGYLCQQFLKLRIVGVHRRIVQFVEQPFNLAACSLVVCSSYLGFSLAHHYLHPPFVAYHEQRVVICPRYLCARRSGRRFWWWPRVAFWLVTCRAALPKL